MVSAKDVNPQESTDKRFVKSKLAGPEITYAQQPSDKKEASDLLIASFSGEPDIDKRPKYYQPFEQHLDMIFSKSLQVDKMLEGVGAKEELEKFTRKYGDTNAFAFLPLEGKNKDVVWAFNKKSGKPVGIIDINPWTMVSNNHEVGY